MNKIVELKNVCFTYDKDIIVDNFSLEVNEGEFVAVTGRSGTGKTTLLNLMSMLSEASSGEVVICGKVNPKFNSDEGRELLRNKLSIIFQNNLLVENDTVKQNLEIQINDGEYTINEVLSIVNLSGYEDKKIYELSGGEQQRVAIARALLKKSEIILADEITGNLDTYNRDNILSILKKLNKTIILVTHDMVLAQSCDRIIEIKRDI